VVLGAAIAMVVGLIGSLTVRRRRIWFRVPASGPVVITAGGLARTDSDRYSDEFTRTVDAVGALTGTVRPSAPAPPSAGSSVDGPSPDRSPRAVAGHAAPSEEN